MGEPNGYRPFPKGFATAAIHHNQEPEQWDSMSVVTPLVTSTTYKQFGPANFKVTISLSCNNNTFTHFIETFY